MKARQDERNGVDECPVEIEEVESEGHAFTPPRRLTLERACAGSTGWRLPRVSSGAASSRGRSRENSARKHVVSAHHCRRVLFSGYVANDSPREPATLAPFRVIPGRETPTRPSRRADP